MQLDVRTQIIFIQLMVKEMTMAELCNPYENKLRIVTSARNFRELCWFGVTTEASVDAIKINDIHVTVLRSVATRMKIRTRLRHHGVVRSFSMTLLIELNYLRRITV